MNQDGKRTGTGKGNPLAKAFADEFGAKYADVAQAKPIYRQLENLYRAVALVNLMRSEAKAGSLAVIEDTFDAVKPAEVKAADTLPGRGAVKKIEGKVVGGS